MIRSLLVATALVLTGAASLGLYRDTRHLLRAPLTIPQLPGLEQRSAGEVVIVLQPRDCLRSGELVARWNELYSSGRFAVRGMLIGESETSAASRGAFANSGIRFPLRPITESDARLVAQKLGYTSTPFVVVVDRNGRVAASFPGAQSVPAEAVARLAAGDRLSHTLAPAGAPD